MEFINIYCDIMKVLKRNGIEYVYDNKNKYVGRKDKMPKIDDLLIDRHNVELEDWQNLNEIFYKAFMEMLLSVLYDMRNDVLSNPNKYGLDSATRVDRFYQSWFNSIQDRILTYGIPEGILDRLETSIRESVVDGHFVSMRLTPQEFLRAVDAINKQKKVKK